MSCITKRPEDRSYQSSVEKVSGIGIAGNLLLAGFKLVAGIVGHSRAMISDALHSASDIAGGIIVVIGVQISEKKEDRDHPYGHERLESIASILLAVILLVAGLAMGSSSVETLVSGSYRDAPVPGGIALAAAIVSILVKESMYWMTLRRAKALNSEVLQAEALHHRSDSLSSIGSLAGIAGARMGIRSMDAAAGLVICAFILKSAYDIFREAMEKLIDHRSSDEMEERIRNCVSSCEEVKRIDLLRTREFGRKVYVDLEISMDGSLTLEEAHSTAERIHDALEEQFPEIKHVMIHMNPV